MDERAKEKVLKAMPYGLYAIGVRRGEERNAFTANWLTQCSFEPPMVALAVERDGKSVVLIRDTGVFSVNLWGAEQRRDAGRLARPAVKAPEKLAELDFRDGETGVPLLTGTLGYVECRVEHEVAAGDHVLFVARVVAAGVFREGDALEARKAGFSYAG